MPYPAQPDPFDGTRSRRTGALALSGVLAAVLATAGCDGERKSAAAVIDGITLADMPADTPAAHATAYPIVSSIQSESRAHDLGLAVGDQIEAVDGIAVHDIGNIQQVLARQSSPNIDLLVRHDGTLRPLRIGAVANTSARR